MANKIQTRRDLAAVWASVNPVLADGELAIETDTRYMKFGDGSTPWNALGYIRVPTSDITVLTITGTPPNGVIGLAYSFTPTIAGGSAPYTVSVTGTPPAGTTLTNPATGNISGTLIGSPASYADISMHVVDALGASADLALPTIVISASTGVAPGQVTGLTLGTASTTQQPLSWTAPTTGTTPFTYLVEYKLASSGTWLTAAGSLSSNAYTVTGLAANSSYNYRVTASNGAGPGTVSAPSTGSTAAAVVAPTVTTQPGNATATAGGTATFTSAFSTGGGTLTYQWERSTDGGTAWTAIGGATAAAYTTPATTVTGGAANNGDRYRNTATNSAGSATTNGAAALTVNAAVVAPTVTTQPGSSTVTAGATATFTAAFNNGGGTLAYQWQSSADGGTTWANVTGGTGAATASYTTAATTVSGGSANNANRYRATATNSAGSVTTNGAATLTVNAAIETRPRQVVGAGTASNATLFAAATPIAGSTAGSRVVGSGVAGFTSTDGGTGQFGNVFILASGCVDLGGGVYGATFTDTNGTGGWSGTTPTNTSPTTTNSGASDAPMSRSNDTYTDSTGLYVRFRMDYHATFTGSIS